MKKIATIDRYAWTTGRDRATAETMLKAERARVRRMVRKMVDTNSTISLSGKGYAKACDDILAKLKEGR